MLPLLHHLPDPLDLRKYPAPSFLAATHSWILKETWLQRRSRSIHRQHEKLGDVIRIAPSLIIFNIPEAVPDIYGHAAAQLSSIRCVKIIKQLFSSTNWLKQSTGAHGIEDFDNLCINQLTGRLDNSSPNRPQQDFMSKILQDREGKPRKLSFEKLLSESIVFMNAGSETTAAALSSTLYFLLSNPKCFEKLRAEIDARLGPNHDGIVSYDSTKDLPYLRACLDESLRLRPPIAYALQRLVVSPQGAIIAGHHIKQGTTVAVSLWTIHRNRKLYKNPDEFDPERCQGPRQCLSRHIAIVELQILFSTLVRRYDMYLADQEMDFVIFDRFNSNPGPLPVKVERRVFVD
ncbi:cytochrome P450 monooxygenase [Fusarium denticulatum]|uniref:Cytochrome P450 monooxygenase n=1 Tax=Fusarium denticulatum TaxID=48507 RepID=A0A8H5XJX3_9HYPO|nr:cytochrome P450 monooxygenase [Fusarium denticulatum]